MNKKTNAIVTVEVVGLTENISPAILDLIKKNHGRNTTIKTVTSPLVLDTPYGFSNLLQRRRKAIQANTRFVYVIKTDLKGCAFENGTNTNIPFNSLFTNAKGKWDDILLEGRLTATA